MVAIRTLSWQEAVAHLNPSYLGRERGRLGITLVRGFRTSPGNLVSKKARPSL